MQDKGQGQLVERLPRSVGTAIGLELRDSSHALSATNAKPVKAGMAFNVVVGGWSMPAGWCLGFGAREGEYGGQDHWSSCPSQVVAGLGGAAG